MTATAAPDTDRTLSARDAASIIGTDGRTLRKFLRASSEWNNAGKGKRYAFTAKDVERMTPQFAAWADAHTRAPKDTPSDDGLRDRLSSMTVKDLREVLDAHGIAYNKSRVVKADLVEALVADRDVWA